MSIEGKHSYRFVYLKSDQWQNVRVEALARASGKCQICQEESISNDAHHMWYPENIWETTADHLVILCRQCHEFIHTMVPECKTNDEEKGRDYWLKFRNAIVAWRAAKLRLFTDGSDLQFLTPKLLREEYLKLKQQLNGGVGGFDKRKVEHWFEVIKRASDSFFDYAQSVNSSVDTSEYQI